MMRLAVLSVCLISALAGQAEAHAFLARAEPRVGSTIAVAPSELRLEFTQPIEPALSDVTLDDPSGASVALGKVTVARDDGGVIIVAIPGPLAPGAYHVVWHVVSVDTHRTEGDYTFTLKP